ncbi:MAG: hypothetical protein JO127_14005 [Caulobacteraceae bacterium]|nr:hypothetical protein [Caulobacteraceae bacterium]
MGGRTSHGAGLPGKDMASGWAAAGLYGALMPDRIAYPALLLVSLAMVALALVWPQGLGAPSPAPFGHPLAPIPAEAAPPAESDSLLGVLAPAAPPAPAITIPKPAHP